MPDPTPLDRAREGCPICGGTGSVCGYAASCSCGNAPCPECARVERLIREADDAATERACRAVCGYCNADLKPDEDGTHLVGYIGGNPILHGCPALPIRRAAEGEGSDGNV